MSTQPIERSAVHEAGHVAAALLTGWGDKLVSATIETTGDSTGHVELRDLPEDPGPVEMQLLAINRCGGLAAEGAVFGNHNFGFQIPRDESDYSETSWEDYLSLNLDSFDGSDFSALCATAAGSGHASDIEGQIQTWASAAVEMISAHEGLIMDIAVALLEEKTLDGDALRQIGALHNLSPPIPTDTQTCSD